MAFPFQEPLTLFPGVCVPIFQSPVLQNGLPITWPAMKASFNVTWRPQMVDSRDEAIREWEQANSREFARWDEMMRCFPPETLEIMNNEFTSPEGPADFEKRGGDAYLKDVRLDLNDLDLTDKQLVAISLVFYGGLKKRRAARAMKISSQALTEHIQAGLKKIRRSFQE